MEVPEVEATGEIGALRPVVEKAVGGFVPLPIQGRGARDHRGRVIGHQVGGVEDHADIVPEVAGDRRKLEPVELRQQPVDVEPGGRNRRPVIDRVQGLEVVSDWGDGRRGGRQKLRRANVRGALGRAGHRRQQATEE